MEFYKDALHIFSLLKAFCGYHYIGKKNETAFPVELPLITLRLGNIAACLGQKGICF